MKAITMALNIPRNYERVYNVSPKVIGVNFENIEMKKEFLEASRKKTLFTSDILNGVSEDFRKKIEFNNFLTAYYLGIEMHLKKALRHGKINGFKLTEEGFAFKKSKASEFKVILSIEEFEARCIEADK